MTNYTYGKTTKAEYIADHPRTFLAKLLKSNDWPDDQRIEIVGGRDMSHKSSNMWRGSNLEQCLKRCNSTEYIKGGTRASSHDGFSFAVKDES